MNFFTELVAIVLKFVFLVVGSLVLMHFGVKGEAQVVVFFSQHLGTGTVNI